MTSLPGSPGETSQLPKQHKLFWKRTHSGGKMTHDGFRAITTLGTEGFFFFFHSPKQSCCSGTSSGLLASLSKYTNNQPSIQPTIHPTNHPTNPRCSTWEKQHPWKNLSVKTSVKAQIRAFSTRVYKKNNPHR